MGTQPLPVPILAWDLPDFTPERRRLLRRLEQYFEILKLGHKAFWTITEGGHRVFDAVGSAWPKQLLIDIKIKDTAETVRGTTEAISDMPSVGMMTIDATVGPEAMAAAVRNFRGTDIQLFAVSVTTDMDDKACVRRFGKTVLKTVCSHAKLAKENGVDGIVCSGHELHELKARGIVNRRFLSLIPAIRFGGIEVAGDDQKRTCTLEQVVELGADYFVVGRAILARSEPWLAAQQLGKVFGLA